MRIMATPKLISSPAGPQGKGLWENAAPGEANDERAQNLYFYGLSFGSDFPLFGTDSPAQTTIETGF